MMRTKSTLRFVLPAGMQRKRPWLCTAAIAALVAATPASADTLTSGVAFNNGIGKKTATQPADGVEVAYQITLQGGDLDGCAVDVVEQLYGREEGAWGVFDIAGDVKCDRGGFSYTSSGAWDGNGFHAAGAIEDGSGSGDFEGVSGRVAQLKGGGADAGDGTFNISYDLVFDAAKD
ncbi:MAG: hypothetical protein ACREDZ_07545 [Kiloniellales bacterium]